MELAVIDAMVAQPTPLSAAESFRYSTPIANVPLIRHVFDELAASGIARATIVAHPAVSDSLHRILGGGATAGVEISWATSSEPARDAVLAEVGRALDSGAVLLHPGDSLFGDQMRSMAARFETGDIDSVLPGQAAVSRAPATGADRLSDTAIMLGPATRSVLKALQTKTGERKGLIESLLQSDCRLAVCAAITQHWTYGDTAAELLTANRMLLDAMPLASAVDQRDGENEIYGRALIDPTASISGSLIHGPVTIDSRAVIEDSFVGPYTAIGAGAVLRGAEVDNTMVLPGAEISHPNSRIEGSIIGEHCKVTRSFTLPRGLRLHLAHSSSLTIS